MITNGRTLIQIEGEMIYIVDSITNVPHSAFEIYVSGCTRHCKGCQNEEIQAFGIGTPWVEWEKKNSRKYLNPLIKRIWILGGDLLCQSYEDIVYMIKNIRQKTDKELWLWTGETLDNILNNSDFKHIAKQFDYIKSGPYDANNTNSYEYPLDDGVTLKIIGDNQKIHKVSEILK